MSEFQNTSQNEAASNGGLGEPFKGATRVETIPALTPEQNAALKTLASELKMEFGDSNILKNSWGLNLSAYLASFVWMACSGAFVWYFYKSLSDFKSILEAINTVKDPQRFITFLIIQKIGFATIGITIIISLYKFSRYLSVQAISYRYVYLSTKIKVAAFLSVVRFGGQFSDSLIEKFISQKYPDHRDTGDQTIMEGLVEKLGLLLSEIKKIGVK